MKPLGSSILAAALTLSPAPAAAAGPPPSEWVGQWEVEASGPGICAATRIHAGGTRVDFFGYPDGTRMIHLSNSGWPQPSGGPYKLASLRGRERLELDGKSSTDGLILELGADLGNRVAASDAIEVVRPDGSLVEKVHLSGIAAAEARLPGCMARAPKDTWTVPAPMAPMPPEAMVLPPPGTIPVRARPLANLATLFSTGDYPEAAWKAREEGRVGVLLLIGKAGRVESCSITSSSGSATLDSATCPLLVERARFEPARDRWGRPAADRAAGGILWRLPPKPLPLERQGLDHSAHPKFPLQTLYSHEDYPSAAIRAGEQGPVDFKLFVGANGRVVGCMITASSGSESLDSATCRVLAARAVFEPARDRQGRPATDSVNGRIVWSLESEPPPPPQ